MVPYYTYGRVFQLSKPHLIPELIDQRHERYVDYLAGATESTAEECVRFHLGLAQ
jgi:hypothetical protein